MSDIFEDAFIAVVPWFLGSALVVMIGCGLYFGGYYLIDSVGVKTLEADGFISNESFRVSHTELRFNAALKMAVPTEIPDRWFIEIQLPGGSDVWTLSHAPWDWQRQGCNVHATYTRGRLSKDFDIKTIKALR